MATLLLHGNDTTTGQSQPALETDSVRLAALVRTSSGAASLWEDANTTSITVGGGAANTGITLGKSGITTTIPGDLDVQGTTTTIDTQLQTADRYILSNSEYTADTALTAGMVFNIDPDGTNITSDTVTITSNSIITFASFNPSGTGFAVGDIILYQNPATAANVGLYEISAVTTSTITIDATPAEDFTNSTLTNVGAGETGTIVQVKVAVIRSDSAGTAFETGFGDATPISFSALGTGSTLQDVYEAGNTISMTDAEGNFDISAGSGTPAISLDAAGASNFTVASASLTLSTTTSGVLDVDAAGILSLNSSAVINIGNDAVAQNINIGTGGAARTLTLGNSTGATAITLDAGTGGVNVGTNAIAHTITVGNATGATLVDINSGTGGITLDAPATADIALTVATDAASDILLSAHGQQHAFNSVAEPTLETADQTIVGAINELNTSSSVGTVSKQIQFTKNITAIVAPSIGTKGDFDTLDHPDGSTTTGQRFEFTVPDDYLSGDLILRSIFAMSTSVSADIVVATQVDLADISGGTTSTINSEANSTVTPPTDTSIDQQDLVTVAAANFAAGDRLQFFIKRIAGNGSDTHTGDWQVIGYEVTYTSQIASTVATQSVQFFENTDESPPSAGTKDDFDTRDYADAVTREEKFQAIVPEEWDQVSDITIRATFAMSTSVGSSAVVISTEGTIGDVSDGTSDSLAVEDFTLTVPSDMSIIRSVVLRSIPASALGRGDQLLIKFKRKGADGSDSHTGTFQLLSVELSTGTTAAATDTANGSLNGFRLTLESDVPVSNSDQTAKTTIYFTPFEHSAIAVLVGGAWITLVGDEVSVAISTISPTPASGENYDVFAYSSNGTLTLEFGAAWTNDTTRSDAISRQDGVFVLTSDKTRRLVGTIRTTGTTTTEDSEENRFVSNASNRVRVGCTSPAETTNFWSYTTAAYRQANGSTLNQWEYVECLPTGFGALVFAEVYASNSGGATPFPNVGVGVDSTAVNSAQNYGGHADAASPNQMVASYRGRPGTGRHVLAWLEIGDGGVVNFGGDWGGNLQHGIHGEIMA